VTILNTVSSDDPIAVDVAVDEKQIGHFITMQQKGSKQNDSTFQIILPDGTLYPYPGSIYTIDRAVDPNTGTIKVRLTFPNSQRALKPGMNCNLRVKHAGGTMMIMIPYKAVVEQMGEYFAFVVNGNTVTQRKLSLGARIGDKVVVKDGLQPGEQIATEGVQKLKEGAKVQIGKPGQPAQAK
jgi:membrane fusion protein (multidrug efflux system)